VEQKSSSSDANDAAAQQTQPGLSGFCHMPKALMVMQFPAKSMQRHVSQREQVCRSPEAGFPKALPPFLLASFCCSWSPGPSLLLLEPSPAGSVTGMNSIVATAKLCVPYVPQHRR
jgi:hypothetical protein